MEDDPTITQVLERQLEKWGYQPGHVEDFTRVVEEFVRFQPHLVLMDLSLPFYNGFHWCGELRRLSKVPILFLSSAGDSMNLVMAVSLGADDFIAKPFDLEVLTAKIQALLRRAYSFGARSDLLEHRGAVLNCSDATLLYGEQRLELTKNEFRILQLLLENRGRTVSRDTIIGRLWESDSFIDDNTLTVNMTRLRKKLGEIGLTDFILTKKGLGYLIQ